MSNDDRGTTVTKVDKQSTTREGRLKYTMSKLHVPTKLLCITFETLGVLQLELTMGFLSPTTFYINCYPTSDARTTSLSSEAALWAFQKKCR